MILDFQAPDFRNPMFLHPALLEVLPALLKKTAQRLGPEFCVNVVSTYRTAEEQFKVFQQEHGLIRGLWQQKALVKNATCVDGKTVLGAHNYHPAQACSLGIFFRANGAYLQESELYKEIGPVARAEGLAWGGRRFFFRDYPYVELPRQWLFHQDRCRSEALVWQVYLQKAGTYRGALDGLWGSRSRRALMAATGSSFRSRATYRQLFQRFGQLSASEVYFPEMECAA